MMKRILKLIIITILLSLSALPIFATNSEYVRDEYGLLTSEEVAQLDALAKDYSNEHDVGIYVRVLNSTPGSFDLASYAETVYHEEGLGDLTNGNMILLIISMDDRAYQYVAHGDKANAAFTDYGKRQLDNYVLGPLKNGDYYRAFNAFISECDTYLDSYESGDIIDVNNDPSNEAAKKALGTGATFGLPPLVALLTCLGLKSRNKSVATATTAKRYIPKHGVNIVVRQDSYLYSNTSRVKVVHHDDNHSSGGTTINVGGFSSHGGHF